MPTGDSRLTDLLVQWEELHHQGQSITPEELCAACPELLQEVKRQIQVLKSMDQRLAVMSPAEISTAVGSEDHAPALSNAPPPSTRIGNYELLGEIARGGMGIVYKARQVGLNRIVALKTIRSGQFADQQEIERFHTEAEAAAGLDHDHIVPIFEVGEDSGRHFFSMAYVEGQSLASRLRDGPLPAREAAELMQTVARAVDFAHTKGIIHRDLKPGNVILDSTGRPYVTDFGLAKRYQTDSHLTATGQVLGTPSFMPPEQAEGNTSQIGPPADVYSLGAVLYNLLTGRPPFQAPSLLETLAQVRERDPVPPRILNPTVPRDLDTIALKCLEKSPARRFASANEIADELGRFLRGEPIVSRPIGQVQRGWRWCKRRPTAAALVAASSLAAVALVVVYVVSVKLSAATAVADANQKKIEAQEETKATLEYTNAVNEAKAGMRTHSIGRYLKSLESLSRATRLTTPARNVADLRNLMAECLTGFDLKPVSEFSKGLDPNSIAFALDAKSIAVVEDSAAAQIAINVRVHRVPEGELIHALSAPSDPNWIIKPWIHDGGRSLQFSPDGNTLALGTRGGWVHLWNLKRTEKVPAVSWQPPKPEEPNRHADPIWELSFSPDGKTLFTRSHNILRAWDVTSEKPREIKALSGKSDIRAFCVVPEAGALAVMSGTLSVIDERDFHLLRDLGEFQPGRGQGQHVYASRDGRIFALTVNERLLLIDAQSGRTLRTLIDPSLGTTHDDEIISADFHPDGSLLVTTGDKRFKVWETASGRLLLSQPLQTRSLISARFSPDGRYLAVTGDMRVELHEVAGAANRTTIASQLLPVAAIDVSPDGRHLASFTEQVNHDRATVSTAFSLWNLEESRLKTFRAVSEPLVFGKKSDLPSLTFDPLGRFFAYTGRYSDTTFVDLQAPAPMPSYDAFLKRDGAIFVEEDKFEIGPPDVADRRPDPGALNGTAAYLRGDDAFRLLLKTANVPKLDVANNNWFVFVRMRTRGRSSQSARYLILNRKGGSEAEPRIIHEFQRDHIPDDEYHWYYVDYLAPHWVALAGEAKSMTLQIGRFQGVRDAFVDQVAFVPAILESTTQIQFSPDGGRLWGIHSEVRVSAWSIADRHKIADFDNSKNPLVSGASGINAIAVGSKWVLLACQDSAPRLLQADNLKIPPRMWRLPFAADPISSVALNADGTLAAVGTSNARLWVAPVPEGKPEAELKGHSARVTSLVFSKDGKLLFSASQDATIRIWRKTENSWEEVLVLPSESGPIDSIRLTPDRSRLLYLVKGESAVRMLHFDRLRVALEEAGLNMPDGELSDSR